MREGLAAARIANWSRLERTFNRFGYLGQLIIQAQEIAQSCNKVKKNTGD